VPKSKEPPAPSGVYAALLTPRRPNSADADAAAILDYLDAIAQNGISGLVLLDRQVNSSTMK